MGILDRDDDIFAILNDPNVGEDTLRLAQQVQRKRSEIESLGLDPELTTPRSSFFGNLLDTLDAPRQGIAGVVDAALRGDMFSEGVGTGFRRGQTENVTTSDILRRHDVIDNPLLRGAVGFAGDILTDPLTYLSFGAGAAAKAGGRVLTAGGQEVRNAAIQRLSTSGFGDDILGLSNTVDDAFKAAGRYQESAKRLSKAESESARALEASQMAKELDRFSSVLSPEEVMGKELFEQKALRVSASVPVLGNFLDTAKNSPSERLIKDVGPVGQAFRLMGKVWSPGRVDIAKLNLSDEVVEAMDNVRMYTNAKIADLGAKVAEVPVVGKAADVTAEAFKAANNTFRKIFMQKSLVGADANNNRLDFLNYKAAAKTQALEKTFETLGRDILPDKALQREIYLAIDAQAMDALQSAGVKNDELLEVINRIRQTGQTTEGDQILLRKALTAAGAETGFRQRLDNLMQAPDLDPRVKDGVTRVMRSMDELASEEAAAGMGYSALEYYVPHKYMRVDGIAGEARSGAKLDSFTKKRKYDTISEAFEKSGKVADTDLASLLQHRFEKSLVLRAQRQYWDRLVMEEGLDVDQVSRLYKEAQLNPTGEAARALRRHRIPLSKIDTQALDAGQQAAERQKIYAGLGVKNPESARLIAEDAADVMQKTNQELWTSGTKPLDNLLPQQLLGEVGELVEGPKGYKAFLPKPIADAFKETVASRDILRDTIGNTPFGRSLLGGADHTMSMFKKIVTLPFPAYWGQNFLGDRFNQLMQGPEAMSPGLMSRTYNLLNGRSSVKSANGLTLDKPTLEKIIKEMGMSYSVNDYLGTVESFGKMDIDKFLAKEGGGLWQNVKKGKTKANRHAALEQLHDKFQRTFDGFQRINHFVHRFEKGDTIADAVRASQEAYFNYRDLHPVEQSLFRRFYMFYTYMSKATKQSVTSLITRPGNLSLQLHGVNALAETMSDPNAAPTAEAHDMKLLSTTVANEQLSRVVGKTPEGQAIVGRGFAAPLNAVMSAFSVQTPRNFSVSEIMDATGDSVKRTIQKQFATANPAINAAAQVISGKNLYFDKPLSAEFLRKVPSLNAAAENLLGYKHNELPLDLDAATKYFLNAVPDGKGRLIADPGKFWILMNLVPGLGRLTSTVGSLTNTDVPLSAGLMRAGTGVNLDDTDPSRTYLYQNLNELNAFADENSVRQRLRNLQDQED